jgi:hypothetical protein
VFIVLLWLLAPLLAFVVAFSFATLFPRFCGYLLGPAFLLSAAIFFVTFHDDIFRSGGQSDAWPGNFVPLIAGYGGVVWCVFGVILLTRGLAVVQRLAENLPIAPRAPGNSSQTSGPERLSIPGPSRITPFQIFVVASAIEVFILVLIVFL